MPKVQCKEWFCVECYMPALDWIEPTECEHCGCDTFEPSEANEPDPVNPDSSEN